MFNNWVDNIFAGKVWEFSEKLVSLRSNVRTKFATDNTLTFGGGWENIPDIMIVEIFVI